MSEAAPAPARRRLSKPQWLTLGAAGFIMSVTLAIINAFYAVRGAEVIVQPPEQVLLYRDGEGDQAVLNFAIRLAMINAADGAHGDVLMKSSLAFKGLDARFAFGTELTPVFGDDDQLASGCDSGARCVALPGLKVTELGETTLDVPGGGVKALTAGFPLVEWNCEGRDCAKFADADAAATTLAGKGLEPIVTLEFFGDGNRRMTCAARAIDEAYLKDNGWMSARCRTAGVTGDPWL